MGETIRDRYEPLGVVGHGGQGQVLRALDRVHGRQVALKVRRFETDAERDAILSEARILLGMAPHPNLAVAREDFVVDDACYLVMDWVEGRHLAAVLDTEGVPGLGFERVMGYLAQVADALDHLHDQTPPVVHGDVKPANLVLTADGRVVLVDFGISTLWGGQPPTRWGTPNYAAPEIATSAPVPASDVYGLAVTAYTLLTGAPPAPEVRPAFTGLAPGAHDGVLRALRRGLATDPGLRPATPVALVEAVRAAAGSTFPAAAAGDGALAPPVPDCPYRGLFAFREDDARFFFGREDVTRALVDKVAEVPFVAVVGASGSGKSSLVWAGLVPWLRRSGHWLVAGFRPGPRPLHSLAAAMLGLIDPDLSEADRVAGVDRLAAAFITREGFLAETAKRVVAEAGAERLLLVVDQFEELYADDDTTGARTRFIDRLLAVTGVGVDGRTSPLVSVVVTLRADFLGHALDHRPLADALQRGDVKLGPMTPDELAAAVEQPAAASGVAIEDGLSRRLLDSIAGEPGNLPLLSFALSQLWGHQENGVLTHGAYERMGGVESALAGYADEVFDSLGPDDQLRAKAVLLQLVRPGEGTEDTRRLSNRAEIGEDGWRIVPALAGARLVVTGRDEATGTDTVEIVHEALIRQWGRLRRWMSAERSYRTWQERFRAALRQWETSGWDDGALLRGAPLAEASDWMAQRPEAGSAAERQFLEASQAAAAELDVRAEAARQRELEAARDVAEQHRLRAEAEHARARQQLRSGRLLRLASAALVVLLVVAVGTAAAVRNQRNESRRLRLVALTEAMAARVDAELEERLDERALLVARQAWLFDRETGGSRNPVVDRALRQALGVPNFSRILGGYDGGVASVAVSPDARFVATGGFEPRPAGPDGGGGAVVTVRDLDDPAADPVELAGHEGQVAAVAWRPSGGQLATAGSDGTVRLWRPGRDEPELRVERVGSPLTSLVFAPGGAALVVGTDDGSLVAWDVRDRGSDPVTVEVSSGPVTALAAAPAPGLFAAGGEDGQVRLVDLTATGAVTVEADTGAPVRSVAFDPEGAALAAGTDDGRVVLLDVRSEGLTPRGELPGHRGAVNAVAFAPDGETLASGGDDRSVRIWTLSGEAAPVVLAGHTAAVTSVMFADESRPTLFTGSRDQTVRIWELGESGPARQVLAPHDGRVATLDFSEDGRFLVTAGLEDQAAHVHDLADPATGPRVLTGHTGEVTGAAFAAGGTVVTGGRDGTLRLSLGAGDDAQHWVVNAGGPVAALDVAGEGRVLAVATGQTVEVYAFEPATEESGAAVGEPTVLRLDDDVTAVAVSPDGELVAAGAAGGTVSIWDASRPDEPVAVHRGHRGPVRGLAWDPGGTRLASGGDDLTVRLWAAPGMTSRRSSVLSGPVGAVTSVAFSSDGDTVAAASEDGKIRLWDTAEETVAPLVLRSHAGGVTAVVFSPDGGQVASGGDTGSIVLEPTRTATLAAYACNRVGRDLTRREWKELVGPALPYRPVCSRRTT